MSQSKARATRKDPTLREQLARKRAKIVTEYFPLGEEGEQALADLAKAESQLSFGEIVQARNPKADVDIDNLKAEVDKAKKRRDEHCLALRFRGLTEDERDALASEYAGEDVPEQGTDEEKEAVLQANKAKVQSWTFAALATVAQDSDLTAEEWREELTSDRWTAGDILKIRDAIQSAYGAQPADGIPKG